MPILDVVRAGAARWAVVTCLGVSTALLMCSCKKDAGFAMPDRPPTPVSATQAIGRDVPVYLDEIGKTTAREYVSIVPQVTGRIMDIHFTDGAELKKGEKLFTIDPRPYQAALDQAKANVTQSTAAANFAKREYERLAHLVEANAVSQEDYDTKKNAAALADAALEGAVAAVETANLNLEYCTVVSPIDGRAGQRVADKGNVVKANEGSLLVIQRLDPIYADFTVAERDLGAVRKNMAEGTLKVQVRLPDDGDQSREGDLTFLDSAVKDASGTVKLRATLKNEDRHFWAGQFVNVRLILKTKKNAVLVPSVATQVGQKGPFVFVVKADSTADMRPITPGQRQGDLIVIEEGVKPGEQVIINGQIAVTPNGKVHVEEGEGK